MKNKNKVLSKSEIIDEYFKTKKEKIKAENNRKYHRLWYNMVYYGSIIFVITTLMNWEAIWSINFATFLGSVIMTSLSFGLIIHAADEGSKYAKK